MLTKSVISAVNYGTTGFVIGHELSHGFDNEGKLSKLRDLISYTHRRLSRVVRAILGIQFDKEGYKIPWTSEYASQYEERSICFVDQYANYTLDVTNEDGDHVQVNSFLNV